MTYEMPDRLVREANRALRKNGDPAEVIAVVAQHVAIDVVNMTAAAFAAIERHDPACTNLWDDAEPCDCSWASVLAVLQQLVEKVQS